MNDELRAAYARLDGALTPPGDAVALVADRVRARRRRRSVVAVAGAAAAVLLVSSVTWSLRDGPETAAPGPAAPDGTQEGTPEAPSPSVAPIGDLDCPTDERGIAFFDLFADTGGRPKGEIAAGYRNAGVGVAVQGDQIYLLREDGTPFAALHLAKVSDGWRVQKQESCGGETVPAPVEPVTPTAQLDVECDGAGWRVGSVANPEVHASGYREPEEAVEGWLTPGAAHDLRREDDDNVVANLVAPNDRLYASLGLVRIDGYWRVQSVSACTSEFPGLEVAKVFGSGLPLVELVAVNEGHCWIETLEYGGTEWDLRDKDQFGGGGLGPEGFLSIGAVAVDGDELRYVDLSGSSMTFVPADSPGTDANEGICR